MRSQSLISYQKKMQSQRRSKRLGANALQCVAAVLLLLVHKSFLHVSAEAGLHCAVGTASCGNWGQLGGYMTRSESMIPLTSAPILC